MNLNYFGVLVVGTATLDHIVHAGDLSKHFENGIAAGKADPDHTTIGAPLYRNRAGGSAVNTALALEYIARAMHMNVTVHKSMRMGRDENNLGKNVILEEFGNPRFGDNTCLDPMHGRNYWVPSNLVIENGNAEQQGRFIRRGPAVSFAPYDGYTEDVARVVDHCQWVVGNSKPAEDTAAAFQAAFKSRGAVRTILDYSENGDEEARAQAAALLQYADVIVAPHDALLPGMEKNKLDAALSEEEKAALPEEHQNALIEERKAAFEEEQQRTLLDALISLGHKQIAISNSNKSVLVYDNGERFSIKIPEGQALNTNGAGDTRDATLCAAMAKGFSFGQAIRLATDIATFYVQQPSRDAFFEKMPNFLRFHPIWRQGPDFSCPAAREDFGPWATVSAPA